MPSELEQQVMERAGGLLTEVWPILMRRLSEAGGVGQLDAERLAQTALTTALTMFRATKLTPEHARIVGQVGDGALGALSEIAGQAGLA